MGLLSRRGERRQYLKEGGLADVLALIQVLALDPHAYRSEPGLEEELQRLPQSADTWTTVARDHPEFFRVRKEGEHKVSLVARHVLPKNEQGQRELPADFAGQLIKAAVDLHDRQLQRSERWQFLVPVLVVLVGGVIALSSDFIKSSLNERREKKYIARAILVEISEINHQIAVQRDWWRSRVDPKVLEPLISYRTDTYDHYVSKISVLEPRELAPKVEEFYYFIHFVNAFQKEEAWYSTHDRTFDFYCRYDRILGLYYEKKFGPPGHSIFNHYYDVNRVNPGELLSSTAAPERSDYKQMCESQKPDMPYE
jgi:hypothetical protein